MHTQTNPRTPLLFMIRALSLVGALAGCDDLDTEVADEQVRSGDFDPLEDHLACEVPSPELGEINFSAAACVDDDLHVAIAECRQGDPRYRSCDAVFDGWCAEQGGSMLALLAADLPTIDGECGIGGSQFACSDDFAGGCEVMGGIMTCDDPETCDSMTCHMPPVAKVWCCESTDVGTGTGCKPKAFDTCEGDITWNCEDSLEFECEPSSVGNNLVDCTCYG